MHLCTHHAHTIHALHRATQVCSHPAALCEVWLPFNKSLLLLVTTNLELARENPERWESWLRTLVAIAAAPRTVVAANNRYLPGI